jgi:hypothetical protein
VGEDPGEIREEVEQTRQRMSETTDALTDKLNMRSRARQRMTAAKAVTAGKATEAREDLVRTFRSYSADPGLAVTQAKGHAVRAQRAAKANPRSLAGVLSTCAVLIVGFALVIRNARSNIYQKSAPWSARRRPEQRRP